MPSGLKDGPWVAVCGESTHHWDTWAGGSVLLSEVLEVKDKAGGGQALRVKGTGRQVEGL